MLIVSKIHFDTLQYTRRRDKWISLSKLIGSIVRSHFSRFSSVLTTLIIGIIVDNERFDTWLIQEIGPVCDPQSVFFFGPKKMCFMQIESVLQTINRSEPAKNRFSVALVEPDQTAPRGAVWSGSTVFAIPSASFERITLW